MVTGLLAFPPRFTAEVIAAELVTGVVVAELLCTLLPSVLKKTDKREFRAGQPCRNILPLQNRESQQPSMILGCLTGSLKMSIHH